MLEIPVAASPARPIQDSVVKVISTVRLPDPYKPWTRQAAAEMAGSGVVLESRRILTCAHVVSYASEVQIQPDQSSERVTATVEAVDHWMDLAILKVEDPAFLKTHPPLRCSNKLPEVATAVQAFGFPRGGSSLSITRGIVSRMEFATYNAPVMGLRIQIDAALNPGNSGGPVVAGDEMIGIAFSLLQNSQNIGYIIPCEEIQLFLNGLGRGHYAGKPLLMDSLVSFENSALRAAFKVGPEVHGALVTKPSSADANYPLQRDDIIAAIGDKQIDDTGMIRLGPELRVLFNYAVQSTVEKGKVPLTIWRAGKKINIDVPVIYHYPFVLGDLAGTYPSYFVCGPLAFSTATVQYLNGFTAVAGGAHYLIAMAGAGNPIMARFSDRRAFEGEELVVLTSMFPHKLTKGYGSLAGSVVKSINGVEIKNLVHLVELLRDARTEFITIEFQGRSANRLIFRRKEMLASTDDVLADNSIRSQGSADVMAAWNSK